MSEGDPEQQARTEQVRIAVIGDEQAAEIADRLDAATDEFEPAVVKEGNAVENVAEADVVVCSGETDTDIAPLVADVTDQDTAPPVAAFARLDPDRAREVYRAGGETVVNPEAAGAFSSLTNWIDRVTGDGESDLDRERSRTGVLQEYARSVRTASSADEVFETVTAAVRQGTGRPTGVARYEESAGRLRPVGIEGETLDTASVLERWPDDLWKAFADATHTVLGEGDETGPRVAALSIGRHGLLLVDAETSTRPSDAVNPFLATITDRTRAALDRIDDHERIRELEQTVEHRGDQIDVLQDTVESFARIQRQVMEARSRSEVEHAVRSGLSDASGSRPAWIEWQDARQNLADSEDHAPDGLIDTALETREPQFVMDLSDDPPFEPWREAAIRNSYGGVAALPLVHEGSTYGVICVYADSQNPFGAIERRLLKQLAQVTGCKINGIEKRIALASGDAVELELQVSDDTLSFMQFVNESGCEFEFEELTPREDEGFGVFFTIRGATVEEARAFGETSPVVKSLELVDDHDGELLFEAHIRNSTILTRIFEHGAVPLMVTAEEGEGRLTVELPQTKDIRTFVEMLQAHYPGTELVARQEVERTDQPRGAFRAQLDERLTERQLQTLQVAHENGFFEWPRSKTGEELATTLGISQPTLSRHLREGERKVFDLLFT